MSFDPEAELAPVFAATRVVSPMAFTFEDGPVIQMQTADPAPRWQAPVAQGIGAMVQPLATQYYQRCYLRPATGGQPFSSPAYDPGFLERLSQANRARERWDAGWRIYQAQSNGQVLVQKGEFSRAAMPGEYVVQTPGPPRVGQEVAIRAIREAREFQPGFYFCFGETLSDQFDEFDLVRVYFHATDTAVPALLEGLTTALNEAQVPYRLKCPSAPGFYQRADAMVLYFGKRYSPVIGCLVKHLPGGVLGQLRAPTPLFTREVHPGVGVADDPGNGESFGMHRCRLLAEGVLEAWRQGSQSVAARLEAVRRRFAVEGLDLNRPHLNAGSTDIFELAPDIRVAA
ncbi:MAG TPA: T3SS effector HopA1 family protein [Verrucomicrobiae bacterium]|nr:T3SS effector HopA1 family protein [Verrucomicrobiae bacterium]